MSYRFCLWPGKTVLASIAAKVESLGDYKPQRIEDSSSGTTLPSQCTASSILTLVIHYLNSFNR